MPEVNGKQVYIDLDTLEQDVIKACKGEGLPVRMVLTDFLCKLLDLEPWQVDQDIDHPDEYWE